MGYYTDFEITIDAIDDVKRTEVDDYVNSLGEDNGFSWMTNYATGQWSGNLKWYDWREDVAAVSAKFPDITIWVEGHGEDNEDVWKAYFKDGKGMFAKAELVFGDYEPMG